MSHEPAETSDFIRKKVCEDLDNKTFNRPIKTRFPPEPNGFLHVGHAKAICLNFGIAEEFEGASCNLRFDDTNPAKEESRYVESIKEDIKWLGFDWGEAAFHASDYFDKFFELAVRLIEKRKAYVCSLPSDKMRAMRGTPTKAGENSPYRERSVEENLSLFKAMNSGEFEEGAHVLRAKIDMSSPNFNMRDPSLYRIKKESHHRTDDKWNVYPMYDFAHCISDALEGVTHSLCTLEFEDHRPLYDWILKELEFENPPQQTEFARLNLSYTITSKRKLQQLIEEAYVEGWDDPRMPTLAGMRRRGYTPKSIKDFCKSVGVSKALNLVDLSQLNFFLREDLNKTANRKMVVLNPLKVTIENYPDGQVEDLEGENNPENPDAGVRKIPFSKHLYVEREDFMEEAPRKWFRLSPGKEVRLKHAYYVTCTDVIKDPTTGEVIELKTTYDPKTKGGWSDDGRKVKGTLHWVSAEHAKPIEVRMYENLFLSENPKDTEEGETFLDDVNSESLKLIKNALAEPSALEAKPGEAFQFLRSGYFCADSKDFSGESPVYNLTTKLRDSWAKSKSSK